MKFLYFDTWRSTPPPVPYQGCVNVRVLKACSAGDQSSVKAAMRKRVLFSHILKRSKKTLKRAFRYSQAIGIARTLAKVRSNVLAHQSKALNTMAAISGNVLPNDGAIFLNGVSTVAGYRSGHSLYADIITMHPDQIVSVPPGMSMEDASTVVYYSMALEGMNRIGNEGAEGMHILILGGGLHCKFLERFLLDAHHDITSIASPDDKQVSSANSFLRKGGTVVVGNDHWFQAISRNGFSKQIYFLGLDADNMRPFEWTEIRDSWIGLPHSELHNTNIFSRIPLDLPGYMIGEGFGKAFSDMASRSWKPASLLTPYNVGEAGEGQEVDLGKAFCFSGTSGTGDSSWAVERRAAPRPKRPFLNIGIIGLGLWARGNLIPFLLKDPRIKLVAGADQDPMRLQQAAELFDIPILYSDPVELCRNENVEAVFIATWHDTHADMAATALNAGKKVFVEKPLALDYDQLSLASSSLRKKRDAFLAVGYNRPHSALTRLLRPEIARQKGPVTLSAIVREPTIPKTHYYYWPHQGSRIVSNSCHWIDYAFHLLLPRVPYDIQVVTALTSNAQDNNVVVIRYDDGSLASLTFANRGEALINGDEYIDIKLDDSQYMIHDFKKCIRYKEGKLKKIWQSKADRGWEHEIWDVVEGMVSGIPPRAYEEILASAVLVLEARSSFEHKGQIRPITRELLERYQ